MATMLVLTRREGDRIQIGDSITVTVVRISPQAVRIGIEAPTDTVVLRREIMVRLNAPQEDDPHEE
jgi:carbon storage regulator